MKFIICLALRSGQRGRSAGRRGRGHDHEIQGKALRSRGHRKPVALAVAPPGPQGLLPRALAEQVTVLCLQRPALVGPPWQPGAFHHRGGRGGWPVPVCTGDTWHQSRVCCWAPWSSGLGKTFITLLCGFSWLCPLTCQTCLPQPMSCLNLTSLSPHLHLTLNILADCVS